MNTVTGIRRLAVGLARSPVHSYTPTARTTSCCFATLCVWAGTHTAATTHPATTALLSIRFISSNLKLLRLSLDAFLPSKVHHRENHPLRWQPDGLFTPPRSHQPLHRVRPPPRRRRYLLPHQSRRDPRPRRRVRLRQVRHLTCHPAPPPP